ncbi:Heat-inducible transcription repressor HrcA [Halomicronema hongdechloris C2206]|uniref:Heat-inducible transcription repressor HrcA n=1 Tax=Halomicronema hongdechloris C2206 TaxID=1641165 RepID=A0A1Z3HNU4_9CYAN|nr:heat-inducible transcriptional repressor HrcA [Halomicronema hongdechloris]ASC71969.1 Heat-inducible transcription repressor HrcA [Halomicronema hongdechloris C2206]
MSRSLRLSPRQQHVLWATVRHYVATAEPVGSKALVQEYNLSVSPATIRNAMGALERSGLLYQPHTSAGRVPSDSGYRLYVDRLMQPSEELARQVDSRFSSDLNWPAWSLEALLKGAAQVLATLSGYLAVITVPQTSMALIRHLQLIRVESGQILLLVLLDSLATQSMVLPLPQPGNAEEAGLEALDRELQILSNFLTHHLRGRLLSEITTLDWSELDREFQRYADALREAMLELARHTEVLAPTQLIVSGLAEVLRQPEFSESQQLQAILHLLEEEQSQLWSLIGKSSPAVEASRLQVWIGSENPLEPMQGCALVSSTYVKDERPIGSVSLLGPTRMMYENVVAVVEAAADYLSTTLN